MKRLIPLLCLCVSGCTQEAIEKSQKVTEHHLVCKDPNGTVIIDTTDVKDVWNTSTSWYWDSLDGTEHTEVSVPPHACIHHARTYHPGNGEKATFAVVTQSKDPS